MVKQTAKSAPETCGFCRGRRKVDGINCTACNGKGSVLVAQPAKRCVSCKGSGNEDGFPCLICHGTGWANVIG